MGHVRRLPEAAGVAVVRIFDATGGKAILPPRPDLRAAAG